MAAIPKQLLKAYQDTEYRVNFPGCSVSLRVGQVNEALQARLPKWPGDTPWAFVTACNPGSELHDGDFNSSAMRALEGRLNQWGYPFFPGVGRLASWSEDSFFVLGIEAEEAIRLGQEFEQTAIVCGRLNSAAALCFCGPVR